MRLSTAGPASDGARAQLLLVLLILALLPLVLTAIPRDNHGLTFDMGMIPEHLTPTMSSEHAGWIRPHVRAPRRSERSAPLSIAPLPGPYGPRHSLELKPSGELLLDSRPIGLEEFRSRLAGMDGWIDFRPDPHARYEDFVETLVPPAQLYFDRLRLDNSLYAEALERKRG